MMQTGHNEQRVRGGPYRRPSSRRPYPNRNLHIGTPTCKSRDLTHLVKRIVVLVLHQVGAEGRDHDQAEDQTPPGHTLGLRIVLDVRAESRACAER